MKQQAQRLLRSVICPLIAAIIWGSAFVAQGVGAETIPPFAFTATRSWIGAGFLFILSLIIRRKTPSPFRRENRTYRHNLFLGGLACGVMMCIATNLQQAGMADTDPGKAGFITSLYVVLVPIFGLFCRRRAPYTVWIGTVIALLGLYFLCITDSLSVAPSDAVILLCAVFFSFQILIIDRVSPRVNGIHLCCVQLLVNAVISTVLTFVFEQPKFDAIVACWFPLVYVGVMSSGIAYTLQIVSQKNSNPTVVTLLLSLESVFAVLTGWLLLGDTLSAREWLGCALMFGAVTLANIPAPTRKPVKNE
ncbi:MAG: DMT family transporter [Clostridia bacterium]|nr:DMT family transporter [Clostridia bacterium]